MILNLKGTEGALSAATYGNNFFMSTCIKLNVTANAVIAVYDSNNNAIGQTTLLATDMYFIEKAPTDQIKLVSGTALATPVGFTVS